MHTAYAGAAMELAKMFMLHVGATPIPSTDGPVFSAMLTEPHGPSTGAGAQSRQHITLQRGQRTFTIGSIDQVERTVELRGYENLMQLYTQRWKQPMPISNAEIEALLKRIRAFAQQNHFAVVIKEVEVPAAPEEAPTGGKWNVIAFVLVAIVAVVVVVLVAI
jgi:hypothetical protein